jgi:hypothetical protein
MNEGLESASIRPTERRSSVLIICDTDIAKDPRVARQITALHRDAVLTVAGKALTHVDVEGGQPVRIFDLTSRFTSRLLRRAVAAVLLLFRSDRAFSWMSGCRPSRLSKLREEDFDTVLVNDVQCLPWVSLYLGAPRRLVLDAHEFKEEEFAERALWRILVRPAARHMTRRHLASVDVLPTVSEGIAGLFTERYAKEPVIVMSGPPHADLEPQPVRGSAIRLVHVGGYQEGRGLQALVDAVGLLDDRFTLNVFLIESAGRDRFVARNALADRVAFREPVLMSDLPRTLNQYDVGVYLIPPNNLNRKYCLPNKFFEFVQARIAHAIGPSPDMARLVREFDCGVIAEDFSARGLAAVLAPLDAARINEMKAGSHRAAGRLNAEASAEVIRTVVFGGGPNRGGTF